MTERTKTRDHFVVAYDFTDLAVMALKEALFQATNRAATVHLLVVLDSGFDLAGLGIDGDVDALSAEKVQGLLEKQVVPLAESMKAPDLEVFVHCRIGSAGNEILRLGHEVRADRIFVGTHGRTGAKRLFLGSVAEAVVRRSPCPVVVMRPTDDYPDDYRFSPEPADGQTAAEPYESPVQPWRFRVGQDHQVVVSRSPEWPLW